MGFFTVLKIKYDNSLRRHNIPERMNSLLTYRNIRLFAWAFILSRVHRIYQLVNLK